MNFPSSPLAPRGLCPGAIFAGPLALLLAGSSFALQDTRAESAAPAATSGEVVARRYQDERAAPEPLRVLRVEEGGADALMVPVEVSATAETQAPGFLGVRLDGEGGQDSRGAGVAGTVSGSAAAAAGLRAGDVIVALDGRPTADIEELQEAMRASRAGDEVELELRRGGERRTLKITLGALPGSDLATRPLPPIAADPGDGASQPRGALVLPPGARVRVVRPLDPPASARHGDLLGASAGRDVVLEVEERASERRGRVERHVQVLRGGDGSGDGWDEVRVWINGEPVEVDGTVQGLRYDLAHPEAHIEGVVRLGGRGGHVELDDLGGQTEGLAGVLENLTVRVEVLDGARRTGAEEDEHELQDPLAAFLSRGQRQLSLAEREALLRRLSLDLTGLPPVEGRRDGQRGRGDDDHDDAADDDHDGEHEHEHEAEAEHAHDAHGELSFDLERSLGGDVHVEVPGDSVDLEADIEGLMRNLTVHVGALERHADLLSGVGEGQHVIRWLKADEDEDERHETGEHRGRGDDDHDADEDDEDDDEHHGADEHRGHDADDADDEQEEDDFFMSPIVLRGVDATSAERGRLDVLELSEGEGRLIRLDPEARQRLLGAPGAEPGRRVVLRRIAGVPSGAPTARASGTGALERRVRELEATVGRLERELRALRAQPRSGAPRDVAPQLQRDVRVERRVGQEREVRRESQREVGEVRRPAPRVRVERRVERDFQPSVERPQAVRPQRERGLTDRAQPARPGTDRAAGAPRDEDANAALRREIRELIRAIERVEAVDRHPNFR